MPVVVGALGMIPKNLTQHQETIGVIIKAELKNTALLGRGKITKESARNLRL